MIDAELGSPLTSVASKQRNRPGSLAGLLIGSSQAIHGGERGGMVVAKL